MLITKIQKKIKKVKSDLEFRCQKLKKNAVASLKFLVNVKQIIKDYIKK